MRRQFRKDLLITTYSKTKTDNMKPKQSKTPKKRGRKRKPISKCEKRRSSDFEQFMKKYICKIGEYWDSKDLARICGVNESSVYRWSIGYRPSRLIWWHIARYIAKNLRKSTDTEIYIELERTFEQENK